MSAIDTDDLGAAVEAGLLSEAQAASLQSFSQTRAGLRARLPREDEPFELFRGLNDVFVAFGLAMLANGIALTLFLSQSWAITCGAGAVLMWCLAEYFTRRRRMVLPSLVLVVSLTLFVVLGAANVLLDTTTAIPRDLGVAEALDRVGLALAVGALAALAFFARFRLPFALFVAGVLALPVLFVQTGALGGPIGATLLLEDPGRAFDLAVAGPLALTTLAAGVGAFALAMAFDMRDPYRVGRLSRCGFWMHLLAAPLIVNTLALTLVRSEGTWALVALAGVIAAMVVVALVIDRRSFLLAAAGYVALLLGVAFEGLRSDVASAVILMVLGTAVAVLGAGWIALRGRLMRALPAFPGKSRLPPYARVV